MSGFPDRPSADEDLVAALGGGQPTYGQRLNLTPEEFRVLEECGRETFRNKCLPLMLISGVTAHLAVKNGYLKPNPVLGSFPKVSAAVAVAFVIGKMSSMSECIERIKRLPNSPLAETLKAKDTGMAWERDRVHPQRLNHFQRTDDLVPKPQEFIGESEFGSPAQGAGNVPHGGLNDSEGSEHGRKRSFEELRNRNRLEYAVEMHGHNAPPMYSNNLPARPQSPPTSDFGIDSSFPPEPTSQTSPPPPAEPQYAGYRQRPQESFKPVKKNAYGDNWDE